MSNFSFTERRIYDYMTYLIMRQGIDTLYDIVRAAYWHFEHTIGEEIPDRYYYMAKTVMQDRGLAE